MHILILNLTHSLALASSDEVFVHIKQKSSYDDVVAMLLYILYIHHNISPILYLFVFFNLPPCTLTQYSCIGNQCKKKITRENCTQKWDRQTKFKLIKIKCEKHYREMLEKCHWWKKVLLILFKFFFSGDCRKKVSRGGN
jgi:hypothetical protein